MNNKEVMEAVNLLRARNDLPALAPLRPKKKKAQKFYTLDGEVVVPYQVEIQRDGSAVGATPGGVQPRFYDRNLVEYDMISYAESRQGPAPLRQREDLQNTTNMGKKQAMPVFAPQIVEEYDLGSTTDEDEGQDPAGHVLKVKVDLAQLSTACMVPIKRDKWVHFADFGADDTNKTSDESNDDDSGLGFWSDVTGNYQVPRKRKDKQSASTVRKSVGRSPARPAAFHMPSCSMDSFWEGILGDDMDDDRTLFSTNSWWTRENTTKATSHACKSYGKN